MVTGRAPPRTSFAREGDVLTTFGQGFCGGGLRERGGEAEDSQWDRKRAQQGRELGRVMATAAGEKYEEIKTKWKGFIVW